MKTNILAFVAVSSVILLGHSSIKAYEDKTHQKLTEQALSVAVQHAPDLPVELHFDQPLGIQVIAGAGDPAWGEDYSRYDIYEACPPSVNKRIYKKEPLCHFASGLFWADPAWVRFMTFWNDAISLWRKGNKPAAAFILGRAVHLVEDMAAFLAKWHSVHSN